MNDYAKLKEIFSALSPLADLSLEQQQDLLFAKQCLSIWSGEPDLEHCMMQAIERSIAINSIAFVNPWRALTLPLSLSTRLLLAQKYAAHIEDRNQKQLYSSVKNKNQSKCLRIGYLSADFRMHAVGFLVQNMFALHDRTRFEVYAYSYAFNDESTVRKMIEQGVDHFIDIRNRR